MAMKRFRGRAIWLLAGLGMGLVLGLGGAAGLVWSGLLGSNAVASAPAWPQGIPLHASTASTSDTMAMATGMVDEQVEGVFTLDFITGDLQGYVLNPRAGKFVGHFGTNVTNQLPVEKGKKPSYVLTTGTWQPVGASTNQRPANCVVYVADTNTGMVAAYTFPWVKGAASTGIAQQTPMIPLDGFKARNITLRSE
jgi:hypothetical protein